MILSGTSDRHSDQWDSNLTACGLPFNNYGIFVSRFFFSSQIKGAYRHRQQQAPSDSASRNQACLNTRTAVSASIEALWNLEAEARNTIVLVTLAIHATFCLCPVACSESHPGNALKQASAWLRLNSNSVDFEAYGQRRPFRIGSQFSRSRLAPVSFNDICFYTSRRNAARNFCASCKKLEHGVV